MNFKKKFIEKYLNINKENLIKKLNKLCPFVKKFLTKYFSIENNKNYKLTHC
jgi:hypothetical protein